MMALSTPPFSTSSHAISLHSQRYGPSTGVRIAGCGGGRRQRHLAPQPMCAALTQASATTAARAPRLLPIPAAGALPFIYRIRLAIIIRPCACMRVVATFFVATRVDQPGRETERFYVPRARQLQKIARHRTSISKLKTVHNTLQRDSKEKPWTEVVLLCVSCVNQGRRDPATVLWRRPHEVPGCF